MSRARFLKEGNNDRKPPPDGRAIGTYRRAKRPIYHDRGGKVSHCRLQRKGKSVPALDNLNKTLLDVSLPLTSTLRQEQGHMSKEESPLPRGWSKVTVQPGVAGRKPVLLAIQGRESETTHQGGLFKAESSVNLHERRCVSASHLGRRQSVGMLKEGGGLVSGKIGWG